MKPLVDIRSQIARYTLEARRHWRSPEGSCQGFAEAMVLVSHFVSCTLDSRTEEQAIEAATSFQMHTEPVWGYNHTIVVTWLLRSTARLDQRLAAVYALVDKPEPEWDLPPMIDWSV